MECVTQASALKQSTGNRERQRRRNAHRERERKKRDAVEQEDREESSGVVSGSDTHLFTSLYVSSSLTFTDLFYITAHIYNLNVI